MEALNSLESIGDLIETDLVDLGYKLIENSYFEHPRLGTPSYALVYAADPNGGTQLDHMFQDLPDPLTTEDLETVVKLTTLSTRRRRRKRELQAA